MSEKRKFIVTILILPLMILICICSIYFYFENQQKANYDVYQAIEASRKKSEYEIVLLGDSVSRQLFNVVNQSESKYWHLNSNQAIGVLGNYLLLENYLEKNLKVEKVYYIMRPYSFGNNLNQIWTYGYFVLPFLNEEKNLKYLKELDNRKEWRKNKIFLNPSIIKILEKNPNFVLKVLKVDLSDKNFKESLKKVYLSEVSIKYLQKIQEMCIERNIEFKVLASPMSDEYLKMDLNFLNKQIKENKLENIFSNYFDSLKFYPKENFSDGVHFKREIIERELEKIQKEFERNIKVNQRKEKK